LPRGSEINTSKNTSRDYIVQLDTTRHFLLCTVLMKVKPTCMYDAVIWIHLLLRCIYYIYNKLYSSCPYTDFQHPLKRNIKEIVLYYLRIILWSCDIFELLWNINKSLLIWWNTLYILNKLLEFVNRHVIAVVESRRSKTFFSRFEFLIWIFANWNQLSRCCDTRDKANGRCFEWIYPWYYFITGVLPVLYITTIMRCGKRLANLLHIWFW